MHGHMNVKWCCWC